MQQSEKESLVGLICDRLSSDYVFVDVAEKISEGIQEKLASGNYDSAEDYQEFATLITSDIRLVNQDKHLTVRVIPEHRKDVSIDVDSRRLQLMQHHNFGFEKLEIMPGNIGYLNLTAFIETKFAGDTAVAAMSLLSNVRSLIIDLRENGGGSPTMIQLLSTYLFGDEPVHLNSFYMRSTGAYEQFWTLPHVPGRKMPNVPLYLLTSQNTFSGAEEFCYNFQNLARGTVVGAVSGGGAHPGNDHVLNENFEIFVPHGRAVNPISQSNWEGVGIQPDVLCNSEDALDVARRMAGELFKA